MITNADIIYYLVYLSSLILSFMASDKKVAGLFFLRMILVLGLLTEIIVEILQYLNTNENPPYFIYIPLEFLLLCLFYARQSSKPRLARIIKSTGFLFLIISAILGLINGYEKYPSILYNISCFINSLFKSFLLFGFVPR